MFGKKFKEEEENTLIEWSDLQCFGPDSCVLGQITFPDNVGFLF